MTERFDLTSTEELSAGSGDSIDSLAVKVRNASPDFDGSTTQNEVIRSLLEERLASLEADRETAEEKRAELRNRLLGSDETQSDGSLDSVKAEQKRLKEYILR